MAITKIVSGGQTGVDRAGLDTALGMGIPCGGKCPKGRRSEDGRIPDRYPLEETSSRNYQKRTELNVIESDGTLILTEDKPTGGTALTIKLAQKHSKPCLVVDLMDPSPNGDVTRWLNENDISVLNIAGSRESKFPGIQHRAKIYLMEALSTGLIQ